MILTVPLGKALRLYPHKRAIVCGDASWTYREFGERVNRLSQALLSLGVGKGDRVAVLHRNCHRYLECYFAVMQIGAVLVPMNYRLTPMSWLSTIEDAGAKLIIVESPFREQLDSIRDSLGESCRVVWSPGELNSGLGQGYLGYEALLREATPSPPPAVAIGAEDMVQIYYTSGTTGQGKGVVLTHRNVCIHALGTIAEFKIDDRDVWLHAAPMFHLADAWAVWSITWVGGVHVVVPEFGEQIVLEAMERERVTLTDLIPTMLTALVNFPEVGEYNHSGLRLLLSGGSPIAETLVQSTMETFDCDFVQGYGLTETSPYVAVSVLKDNLRGLSTREQMRYRASMGREYITAELRVVDDHGRDVRPDGQQVGEIIIRGEGVMKEYWRLPELTQMAFKDGWLYSGDMAVIDKEGYLTFVDRKRDVISTGGKKVHSAQVENVLYSHPAVLEAAVIGVPDEEFGQAVKAVVALKEGHEATEEEIIQFCRERMARFRVPKSVDFVPSLPKTGSAKIAKVLLKEEYWKGADKGVH